jgi:PAS domain S-box-containing protein
MENDRDGIWIIGADAQTTYANERMAEILGTSPSEMVGRPSFTYVFPEDIDAAQRLFEAKTRGDAKPFHFKLRRKDGSAIWVDVQGTPLYNAAGAFKGIVGTFSVSQ